MESVSQPAKPVAFCVNLSCGGSLILIKYDIYISYMLITKRLDDSTRIWLMLRNDKRVLMGFDSLQATSRADWNHRPSSRFIPCQEIDAEWKSVKCWAGDPGRPGQVARDRRDRKTCGMVVVKAGAIPAVSEGSGVQPVLLWCTR